MKIKIKLHYLLSYLYTFLCIYNIIVFFSNMKISYQDSKSVRRNPVLIQLPKIKSKFINRTNF